MNLFDKLIFIEISLIMKVDANILRYYSESQSNCQVADTDADAGKQ